VIEAGGVQAAIVSVETLLITGDLEDQILNDARLGPRPCLMVTATHTHSGPGGMWDSTVAGWAGAGEYDVRRLVQTGMEVAQAIDRARALMAPAELLVAREDWPDGPARARSEGPIDPGL